MKCLRTSVSKLETSSWSLSMWYVLFAWHVLAGVWVLLGSPTA